MIADVQYSQYVIDHDLQNRIVAVDEGFTRITGYTQPDVKKENITLYDLIPEEGQADFVKQLMQKLGDRQKAYFRHPVICKDGSVTHVLSFVESYKTRAKGHLRSKVLMTDVFHLIATGNDGQMLKQTATLDALTKLFNKDFTKAKINSHLYENQKPNALMLIDIDNFKAIDDTFGHSYGDAVLKDVAKVMRANFRMNFDVLGRTGGNEFVILLNNPPSQNVVIYKAKQLNREIRHTYENNGTEITISSSVGVAFYPEHGKDFQSLYEKAAEALYHVKASGKNGYAIYDPDEKKSCQSNKK